MSVLFETEVEMEVEMKESRGTCEEDAKRRKAEYPDLGLAVDHLRLDAIDVAAAPEWMKPGLSPSDQ